jgi:hypothetical protein
MSRKTAHCPALIRLAILCALFLIGFRICAQTETPATDTPVGHWVTEHTSNGGIGSWWDFRPDGTLTMHIGAIVTSPITRSGNTFTSPPATINGPPIKVTFRIDGDTLHLQSPDTPEQILTRIGPAPSTADPLLGKWKPLPPATLSTDPNIAAQQKLMTNATLVFSAGNTESLRVPFTALEGTWDATAHTFHLADRGTFSFQRTGSKLTLGQPPDGHKTDTYIPDPIL